MARKHLVALAALAAGLTAATGAFAGDVYRVIYPAHPYHVLYPVDVAPYVGTPRKPALLGRHGPLIAMPPGRFHAYRYVSTFDRCVRTHRVPTRHGWRWHRVWVCG